MGCHRPDLVIFDCDGVLIDSETIACRIEAEELTALGCAISAEEVARRFCGVPDTEMRRAIEAEWGQKLPPDHAARVERRTAERFTAELVAMPGVWAVLDALRAPICVASSSGTDKLRLSLQIAGLHDRFAPHIFSADQVTRGKPAPDLFLFAAARMGAEPSRCLVVEDSVAGVTAGKAAGMTVLGFTGGSHCAPDHAARLRAAGADHVFDDLSHLPALLGFPGA